MNSSNGVNSNKQTEVPTKERILQTAFQLFVQHGYEGTSLNAIVSASDVSKGAFYHYFPSKLDIYSQTIQTYFLNPFDKINIVKLAKSSPKKSRALMRKYYANLLEQINATEQNIGQVFALTFDASARIPSFHEKIAGNYAKILKALATSFATPKSSRKAAKKRARKFLAQLEGEVYLQAILNTGTK